MAKASNTHQVEHQMKVLAPPQRVYGLIADVAEWPVVFPPTVHVEHVQRDDSDERIRIWATANGEVKTWTSHRWLDPAALRVEFRQEVSQPPVAAMRGTWIVEPLSATECTVRLLHNYQAVDDNPDHLAWIANAVDRNSGFELDALRATAELGDEQDRLVLSFDDTLRISGDVVDVYDFLYDGARWSERLPHVSRVSLKESAPNIQLLEMDTRTKDGSEHTTTSVRVCFPTRKIVYKQITMPALMTVHTGYWQLVENAGEVTATSQHTVVIKPSAVEPVLGAGKTIEDARECVRNALSANSLATLNHAKTFAEWRPR
jgi:aromatase